MNKVLHTCTLYWEKIGHELVEIDVERIRKVVKEIVENEKEREKIYRLPTWDWKSKTTDGEVFVQPLNPKDYIAHTIYATGGGDACFWTENGHWYYKGLKGSEGWHLLIREIFEEGKKKGKGSTPYKRVADWMSNLTEQEFKRRLDLAGAADLQMIEARVQRLNEVGTVLNNEYEGDPEKILEEVNWKAYSITEKLVEKFPTAFGSDYIESEVGRIYFSKLACLVPILLYEGLPPRGYRAPTGLEKATVAADYRLPQALRGLEILKYSEEVAELVDNGKVLKAGGREEAAIRSATVVASYKLTEEFNSNLDKKITAAHVDGFLFRYGRNLNTKFHRVVTLNY